MTPLPTPQQLRYLVALAQQQHFGRAALACAVTQSTLSAGIVALERQLNARLLERGGGKRVVFTVLGREIAGRARVALRSLQAVAEAAAAASAPMSGALRLGVIPTIGPFLLPRLMPALRLSYPMLRLYVREDTTDRLVERLNDGRLDLLLLALPSACAGAEPAPLARDAFFVALPPGHQLAACDAVPPAALQTENLLLLEEGHCLREQALDVCGFARGAGPQRDPADPDGFAATSLHTLVHMVAGGLGVTLLPRIAVEAGIATDANLVLRPLAGAGGWRTLGLVWHKQSSRSGEYRALVPLLAQIAAGATTENNATGASARP